MPEVRYPKGYSKFYASSRLDLVGVALFYGQYVSGVLCAVAFLGGGYGIYRGIMSSDGKVVLVSLVSALMLSLWWFAMFHVFSKVRSLT